MDWVEGERVGEMREVRGRKGWRRERRIKQVG